MWKALRTSSIIALVIIISLVVISKYPQFKEDAENDKIIKEIVTICESYGLQDIDVLIKEKNSLGYSVEINTSNFSELENEEILDADRKITSVDSGITAIYKSQGDTYEISFSKMTKNGEEIYDWSKDIVIDTSSIPSYSTSDLTDDEKGFAVGVAKQEVTNNLKSPSSAKFPWGYDNYSIEKMTDNKFTVSSYVDAENSFGAEVRTYFTVKFKKTGDDSYVLDSVDIVE